MAGFFNTGFFSSSYFGGDADRSPVPDPEGLGGEDRLEGPNRDIETVEQVCRRNGVDVTSVEQITATSEITDDKTAYVVNGTLQWDGRIVEELSNVAVVGRQNAVVTLPEGLRTPVVDVSGENFVWSGIDFDQRTRNAWARFYARGRNMTLEDCRTIGSGGRANPDDGREYPVRSGSAYYLPAPKGETNTIRGFTDIHGGEFPSEHWGNRPMGIWLGPQHEGTLKVLDTHIEEFGNNGIYASNTPGRVEVGHSRFWNNGVNQIRIAHGHVHDCSVGFDYENTGLAFAKQARHAASGIAAEQKKAGVNGKPGPDVRRTTVSMKNVGKGGHGLRAYDIHTAADWGTIEDVGVHIGNEEMGIAADLWVTGDIESVKDCVFSGDAERFVSVLNQSGEPLVLQNVEWEYPRSRRRSKGDPVEWR